MFIQYEQKKKKYVCNSLAHLTVVTFDSSCVFVMTIKKKKKDQI